MLEIILAWLDNPSGRYADGVSIFTQLASKDIQNKYSSFFAQVTEPKQHDKHFAMLINKVSDIARKVKLNPDAYQGIELVLKETGPDAITQAAIDEKNAKIADLKLKVEALKADHKELIQENEGLSDQVLQLEGDLEDAQDEILEYESQLEALEQEVTVLTAKRGIQIVALKDMPEDLQKKFDRNRELTPYMASLHTQMGVEGIAVKLRKSLVDKLIQADDERRENWDAINDWAEGKTISEEVVIESPEYDSDPMIAGVQMARRIERLKENIIRSKQVAETSEKEVIKANALKRIEAYEAELNDLESRITAAKGNNKTEGAGE